MDKINEIKALVEQIRTDREDLKRKGELTERGKGHLDIVALIEEILNK
ncbi:MAG: hypothetical protein A4E71_00537 [Smithella sp. PtaU1.Bin162]|nr:MAG: hypothetical protein A4E71_00537 [Smithella sp. PtaU1.Bin162]